jgi:hypothetical protein
VSSHCCKLTGTHRVIFFQLLAFGTSRNVSAKNAVREKRLRRRK